MAAIPCPAPTLLRLQKTLPKIIKASVTLDPELFTAEGTEHTEKTIGRQDNGISRMNRISSYHEGRKLLILLPLVKGVGGILPSLFVVARFIDRF
jgi:hypothetical protein